MKPLLLVCYALCILLSAQTKCNKDASTRDKAKPTTTERASTRDKAKTTPAERASSRDKAKATPAELQMPGPGNISPIQAVIDTVKNFNPDTMKNPPNPEMIKVDYAMFNAQIDALTKLIESNPENAKNYVDRGDIKSWINDYEGACADWKKAESLGLKEVKSQIDKLCR